MRGARASGVAVRALRQAWRTRWVGGLSSHLTQHEERSGGAHGENGDRFGLSAPVGVVDVMFYKRFVVKSQY